MTMTIYITIVFFLQQLYTINIMCMSPLIYIYYIDM